MLRTAFTTASPSSRPPRRPRHRRRRLVPRPSRSRLTSNSPSRQPTRRSRASATPRRTTPNAASSTTSPGVLHRPSRPQRLAASCRRRATLHHHRARHLLIAAPSSPPGLLRHFHELRPLRLRARPRRRPNSPTCAALVPLVQTPNAPTLSSASPTWSATTSVLPDAPADLVPCVIPQPVASLTASAMFSSIFRWR